MAITDSTVHTVVGSLMVGSCCNLVLFGIEITMQYYYWRTYVRDHWVLKIMVGTAFLLDIICTVVEVLCVYGYAITGFGDYDKLATQGYEIPTYLICTAITTLIAQAYLTYRLFRLSNNYVFMVFLSLCAVATFATDITVAQILHVNNSYADRGLIKAACVSWLTLAAVTDVLLAGLLIFYLGRFNQRTPFADTKSILRRITLLAAESGSFTSVLALLALTFYLLAPENNICSGFAFLIGRGYSLTLLFNLSLRNAGKHGESSQGTNTHHFGVETFKLSSRKPDLEVQQDKIINVAQETHVFVDKADDFDDATSFPVHLVHEKEGHRPRALDD